MDHPEIMQLAMKPGMMQKLSEVMQNPSAMQRYANDPDFSAFAAAMQVDD